ncbi:hypothetical protein LINGRAHAP2_LOCUS34604 [Linum grandiflorum]
MIASFLQKAVWTTHGL